MRRLLRQLRKRLARCILKGLTRDDVWRLCMENEEMCVDTLLGGIVRDIKVWNIVTALRGSDLYDDTSMDIKMVLTAPLRSIVKLGLGVRPTIYFWRVVRLVTSNLALQYHVLDHLLLAWNTLYRLFPWSTPVACMAKLAEGLHRLALADIYQEHEYGTRMVRELMEKGMNLVSEAIKACSEYIIDY